MLFSAEDHASNPPESWVVVKVAPRAWRLCTTAGDVLDQYPTRERAEGAKVGGFLVDLYEKERRWMAGEQITGWRPFAEIAG